MLFTLNASDERGNIIQALILQPDETPTVPFGGNICRHHAVRATQLWFSYIKGACSHLEPTWKLCIFVLLILPKQPCLPRETWSASLENFMNRWSFWSPIQETLPETVWTATPMALPDLLPRKWKAFVEKLKNRSTVSIPRSYHKGFDGEVYSYIFCGFCDATTAYAAVFYLLMKTQKRMHTQFLVAKTRVAPVWMLTIPRLELLSALALLRLISLCLQPWNPPNEVLIWRIQQKPCMENKEWKTFVENHVNEIHKRHPLTKESLTQQTSLHGEWWWLSGKWAVC